MNVCLYCGKINKEGALICEWCGEPLVDIDHDETDQDTSRERAPLNPYEEKLTAFKAPNTIAIEVQGEKPGCFLIKKSDAPAILGRADPRSGFIPDIDLTDLRAAELGVSRQHAIIDWDEDGVKIEDMDSVNGTLLNRHQLTPNFPRIIRDGDEIELGRLSLRVRFDTDCPQ